MALYKDIVKKIPLQAEKKTKQKEYMNEGLLPIIDQGQKIIGGYTDDLSKRVECDLPAIVFGDHTRCVKLIKKPFAPGADGIKVIRPADDSLYIEYLFYATKYLAAKIRDKGYARHYQDVEKQEINVPSVSVQKEIVSRIEERLSSLDNAVETLNKTKEQLTVYRQTVLKEAFSSVMHFEKIRNASEFVTSGSRGWAKYYADKGALFIRIGNLTRTSIDINLEDKQYVNLPEKAEGKRTRLQPGDVLVSITADLGSIGLVTNKIQEAYVNQHIAMIRFKNPEQGEMYAWFLRSELGQKDLLKNKRGAGKLGLGLDDIRDSRVPNISDAEAKRIVDSIEERFSVCDSIQLTVDEALQQAEAMRQSILKEAFEGRL